LSPGSLTPDDSKEPQSDREPQVDTQVKSRRHLASAKPKKRRKDKLGAEIRAWLEFTEEDPKSDGSPPITPI
jgi:hypothetical protein